jgi:diaminohydroxyphosphoribosylaminopyrimidine deaminase/5-amino-6-(5-phosphoribosylamino)uracil reductase
MEHALELARKATGLASPNPLVGCVIVRSGEIIAQGFHEYDGRKHAEILALAAAGDGAQGATLYVTLEPCNHTGRTGPCSEAIVAAGIKRVVAAMQDPNPVVAGSGFEKLRAAGIEVECGLLEEQSRRLNESFACWIKTQKPFVTVKSALTLDGQLAIQGGKIPLRANKRQPRQAPWITSEESRAEVQRMRHASDALLTGIGTIRGDDPLLTDRSGLPRRRRLLRVILDSQLILRPRSRIVETADDDLLVFTTARPSYARLSPPLLRAGVEVLQVRSVNGHIDLEAVRAELGRRDILSVLVEAGPTLNGALLSAGLVHKLVLFYAPKIAGEQRVPLAFAPKLTPRPLEDLSIKRYGPDFAVEGYLKNVYRNH